MKISKSKQELARIISENGGWRDGSEFSVQNGEHGRISFSTNKPVRHDQKSWMAKGGFQFKIEVCRPLPNWHQTILSRAEYSHLYPSLDAGGWIEWKGGDCPVGGLSEVEVKCFDVEGSFYGIAIDFIWGPKTNIIAYRQHKPEQSGAADKLSSEAVSVANIALMSDSIEELVRKPTIEQLAANYRNSKDYAERKQQEADDAKADAKEKLNSLVAAGNALGLDVSPTTDQQERLSSILGKPELAITDWRDLQVGDAIRIESVFRNSGNEGYEHLIGEDAIVVEVGDPGAQELRVKFGGKTKLIDGFTFIRRP